MNPATEPNPERTNQISGVSTVSGSAPLSFAQQRMWVLAQLDPDVAAYNVPFAIQLRGSLDLERLRQAINEVVARHSILRTIYQEVDDEVRQISVVPFEVGLPVDEIREPDRSIDDWIRSKASLPFRLSEGPAFRVRLLRIGELDHILLFTIHHIAFDAGSATILATEIAVLYHTLHTGLGVLPELPAQYADFAAWQRQGATGERWRRRMKDWSRQLSQVAPLELPTDRPRPTLPTFRGGNIPIRIDGPLLDGLRSLAATENTTLFILLFTALASLLSRYTGQNDITIGVPVSGRDHPKWKALIGLFLNTVVLRLRMDGDPTSRQAIQRTRAVWMDALDAQDIPFEQIVDAISPERDRSRNPLFQIMFAMQAAMTVDEDRGGMASPIEWKIRDVDYGVSKLDLSLLIEETRIALTGTLQYATDLFEAETVERMSRHYVRVLEWMVGHGGERISELELLDSEERSQVLEEWNHTEADYGEAVSLHGWIEQQGGRTPEAVAVEFGEERISYGELMRRSGVLAAGLRRRGVGVETAVGICCERSIELVVGLLGILRAGGAYVPLAAEYPEERLRWMVEDAGIGIVLTQGELEEKVQGLGVEVVRLEEVESWPAEVEQSGAAVEPENAAYIIYTSGSTGRPKGVVNTHGGIVNRLRWMQSAFGLVEGEGVLQKTPYSFDVSVWEFFWALGVGGRVVLARPGGHQDPVYLSQAIEEHRITTIHFVPSMLEAFLGGGELERCVGLKRVMASGEALSGALEREFRGKVEAELHNLYGPTEAAVDVSWWPCVGVTAAEGTPIGRPIGNLRLYVLDERMEPCPVGVSGELYIGGAGLARGYVRRAALTAGRFVPDPHGGRSGERLYRTGDAVRYRADGNIEFIGRLDDQVKLRGFRIELGEIEAVLRRQGGVRGAAVVVRGEGGNRWLAAYLAGERMEAAHLRTELRRQLPEYMIPATFTWLEQLPVTANGKLDRKALPETGNGAQAQHEYVAPRTEQERQMAAIWADVLRVQRVGIHDNFFELGGHSLLAVGLIERMRRAGFHFDVRALFATPTLAQILATADSQKEAVAVPPNRIPGSQKHEVDASKIVELHI